MLASEIIIIGRMMTIQFADTDSEEGVMIGGRHHQGRIEYVICMMVIHGLHGWIWACVKEEFLIYLLDIFHICYHERCCLISSLGGKHAVF